VYYKCKYLRRKRVYDTTKVPELEVSAGDGATKSGIAGARSVSPEIYGLPTGRQSDLARFFRTIEKSVCVPEGERAAVVLVRRRLRLCLLLPAIITIIRTASEMTMRRPMRCSRFSGSRTNNYILDYIVG
jgi:hypothetical protein